MSLNFVDDKLIILNIKVRQKALFLILKIMNGYIEICIDKLKTRIDFHEEDGVSGIDLVRYFVGLMYSQTFTKHTIQESLEEELQNLRDD